VCINQAQAYEKKLRFVYFDTHNNKIHTILKKKQCFYFAIFHVFVLLLLAKQQQQKFVFLYFFILLKFFAAICHTVSPFFVIEHPDVSENI
jgi:hypothetical protein